jgi:peptidoglycan/xylan/chitin deacetylase (PgdA/CDA1 family)
MKYMSFGKSASDQTPVSPKLNLPIPYLHSKAEKSSKIQQPVRPEAASATHHKRLPDVNVLLLVIRNPLVVVLPFVVILGLTWRQYSYAGRDLSLATANLNVMPNANFEQFGSNGLPLGWQLDHSGELRVKASLAPGYVGGNSVGFSVAQYQSGAATFISPKLRLKPSTTYLFKGYYMASTPFELLADYYYQDGTHLLKFVNSYPGETGVWSTASDAFATGDNVTAVQFVYQVASNGNLQLNGLYLEPKKDLSLVPEVSLVNNVIPNEQLTASQSNMPISWNTYHSGSNTAAFSYLHDNGIASLQTKVSNYISGEAKWQFTPQAVTGHQSYQFGFQYESDTVAHVVADYVFADGHQQFVNLSDIMPASQWTEVPQQLEAPPSAVKVFVSVVVQSNGTVSTRNYSFINITKQGVAEWKRPLVSITFDDGWESSFSNGMPLLDRYGYKATFYINPSSIETPNFMQASQLATLRNTGNEIAAHGYDHDDMTAISSSKLNYQLQEGRDYLDQAGFPTTDFATPYGKSDPEVQWYAKKYYSTLRGTETGINTRQNLDPYNLKVVYLEESTTDDTVSAALQQAKQYNAWVIFVYHRVGDSGGSVGSLKVERPTLAEGAVSKQISLIHNSGIAVATVAEAYKEVHEQ